MQNIVILAGNIGQPPNPAPPRVAPPSPTSPSRPRYSEGKVVRDSDGYRVQDTEWHRITVFNGLGKSVQQHCEKGIKVLVRGRIHYTKWTDQQGNDRYGCEIIAETVDFLSRAKQTEKGNDHRDMDEDIPF